MEREVSMTTEMSTGLIALVALISIIWVTVGIGSNIKNTAGASLAEIPQNMSYGYVDDLSTKQVDTDMPTATAYNIFRTYSGVIAEVANGMTGTTINTTTGESDLKNNLSGRVQLEVLKTSGGAYIALVHLGSVTRINGVTYQPCNLEAGVCNCPHKSVMTALKTKHRL